MDVEIGYLPKYYYSAEPGAGGHFPFALEGNIPYVFALDGFYLPECDENWLLLWMENITAFPIYFCAEIPSYWKEDYEHTCRTCNIDFKYLFNNHRFSVTVIEVQSVKQLREVFPVFISIGSGNDLVLWSTNKDAFRVEQREWKGNWEGKIAEAVVAKIENNTSVFWIGYDGDSIAVLSNNPSFSSYENICKTLPTFLNPSECEYG